MVTPVRGTTAKWWNTYLLSLYTFKDIAGLCQGLWRLKLGFRGLLLGEFLVKPVVLFYYFVHPTPLVWTLLGDALGVSPEPLSGGERDSPLGLECCQRISHLIEGGGMR